MSLDTQPSADSENNGAKTRSIRYDVLLAGSILGLITGALAVYVTTSHAKKSPETTELSAAEWVAGQNSPKNSASTDNENTSANAASQDTGTTPDSAADESTGEDTAQVEPDLKIESQTVLQGKIKKGAAVMTSLARLGLSNKQIYSILTALEGIFDFKKAKPGHSFEIHLDPVSKEIVYFRYEASLIDVFEVEKKNNRLEGKKKHIPTQIRTKRFGGTIASSLYKALADMGAHPSLTGYLLDVFATEAQFFKAQRPGDTFRVIVNEETLNDVFLGYHPILALEYNGASSGKRRLFRFEADDDSATYYNEKGISVPRSVFVIPLHYTRLSSPFGLRFHPVLKRKMTHNGVDFSAPIGTAIWACKSGKVVFAGHKGANGNLVIIDHGKGVVSYYAHLQRFTPAAKAGNQVKERQVIGYVGSTGRSTGPHLHFGIKAGGRFVDPLKYKVSPGQPIAAKYKAKLNAIIEKYKALLDSIAISPPADPLSKDEEEQVLGVEELE